MSAAGFWPGAGLAFALSASGTLLYHAIAPSLGAAASLKTLLAALGLVYLLTVLARRTARAGRLTMVSAWFAAVGALLVLDPAPWAWLLVQTVLIWLARCLFVRDSLRGALLDGTLGSFALLAGVAAFVHTGGLFPGLWSYFLVQALSAWVPVARPTTTAATAADFARAEHAARAALRRLSLRSNREFQS